MKKHYDVILNKRYGTVGLYVIPTQIYWYIHGFVYVPIVMYQVFGLLLAMFILYLTYNILILLKFARLRLRYLFVIFFFFPYSLFILSLNVFSCLHEIYRPGNSNVWEKSR
ncbi:MAG: hypothetical protein B6U86_05275 [Candidatus Altiarchaeales archaeon ex4484_43]|nr:MAG: hypothetical protein B6U86_05275 [Candidatus Altiarchaeales archaeon ex4484_43]